MQMSELKRQREKTGMSRQDVADRLGVSLAEYAQCEEQPEDLSLEQARLVCAVLGIGIDSLFAKER